jgi:hypothetical protein
MKTRINIVIGVALVSLVGGVFWVVHRGSITPPLALPPAGTTPQPVAASHPTQLQNVASNSLPGNSRRQFYNMSMQEQDQEMDEIRKLSLPELFQTWIDAWRIDRDLMRQNAISYCLWNAMRRQALSQELYGQMQTFLAESSNSIDERGGLLHVLGEAKTAESLELLIQVANNSTDAGLKEAAIKGVQSTGVLRGDGKFHEELSPALELVWRDSSDKYLLNSVATAIAGIGAPSGIRLLLSSALDGGQTDRVRSQAAKNALQEVLNPDAVPILSEMLVGNPPSSDAGKLASGTLARMNAPASAQSLMNWLENSDESAAPLAVSYVVQARSPAMLKAFQSALDPSVRFRSEQDREAIRAGLAQYKANRKFAN